MVLVNDEDVKMAGLFVLLCSKAKKVKKEKAL